MSRSDETKYKTSQTERRPRVAALTIVEVRLTEGALAVVTGRATLRACIREMLCGHGGAYLFSFRQSALQDRVAVLATETLVRAVSGVAKAYAVGARDGRDSSQTFAGRVALAAGADVCAACLPAGRVALKTGLVRAQSCGSGTGHTAPRWSMTSRAACLRSRVTRAIQML